MLRYLDRFSDCRIAIVGDVMLDCYVAGDVTRVSPEAPVPVMRVTDERAVPGGAANVAANLASLGVGVELLGLVGQDEARDKLVAALSAHGTVGCAGLLAVTGRRTTRKLRIIGGRQQIVRVDHEDVAPIDPDSEAGLIALVSAAIGLVDLVIVSDYGKGVCSDTLLQAVFDQASRCGKRVLVDPKRIDFAAYRGASLIMPNRQELGAASGLPCDTDAQAAIAAARVRAASGADILLTRSEKGMSWFSADAEAVHLPTVAQEVFDVSGAGDTVAAVMGASLAAGASMSDAMRLANQAAGLVVSKVGTASVTWTELQAAFLPLEEERSANGRLLTWPELVRLRRLWRRQQLTVGFTNGCFDLLHPGHVALIQQAAQHCDRLIVALNSDASIRRLKGMGRPVQDEQARAAVVGALRGVAAVTIFPEDTPLALIETIEPDLLVKGADYALDQVIGADLVTSRGGTVLLADLQVGQSSSALIARAAGR